MKVREFDNAILINGDMRDVLPALTPGSVDMIWADPPYGHNNNDGKDLISRREAALGTGKAGPARPIANDGRKEADELVKCMFAEGRRLLPRDGVLACCSGGGGLTEAQWVLWMEELLGKHVMTVIWDKGKIGMGWQYRRSTESVLIGHPPGKKMRWFDTTRSVENIIRPDSGIKKVIPLERNHPTPKPQALVTHFLQLHTRPGNTLLDPFMGGGTAGVAAVMTGRRYVGIELDPHWYEQACIRIERAERMMKLLKNEAAFRASQAAEAAQEAAQSCGPTAAADREAANVNAAPDAEAV